MRTVQETIDRLELEAPCPALYPPLPPPPYTGTSCRGIALAVASMKHHTTDEGWQIMLGLEQAGYDLWGYGCHLSHTNLEIILGAAAPGVTVVQDKREWEGKTAGPGFDERERFHKIDALRRYPETFKLTILKDAQHNPEYHRRSAEEMDCHAWVVYYHPRIVRHLAPYVRPEHLVRTYHTVDPAAVPPYSQKDRRGCLVSGAVSDVYPLRRKFIEWSKRLPDTVYLKHPGYGRDGCRTPEFLRTLSRYKVAVCTSSIYGYALRKIIEATACGCRVITDLPTDEILPVIDSNLVRVPTNITEQQARILIDILCKGYNPEAQALYAQAAVGFYNYADTGRRLARDIDSLRRRYGADAVQGG